MMARSAESSGRGGAPRCPVSAGSSQIRRRGGRIRRRRSSPGPRFPTSPLSSQRRLHPLRCLRHQDALLRRAAWPWLLGHTRRPCPLMLQRPVRSSRAPLPRAPLPRAPRSKRRHQKGGDLGRRCGGQEVRRHLRRRELRQPRPRPLLRQQPGSVCSRAYLKTGYRIFLMHVSPCSRFRFVCLLLEKYYSSMKST